MVTLKTVLEMKQGCFNYFSPALGGNDKVTTQSVLILEIVFLNVEFKTHRLIPSCSVSKKIISALATRNNLLIPKVLEISFGSRYDSGKNP